MENLKLRNASAKIFLAGVILLAGVFSVYAADYKLAQGDSGNLSFYKSVPSDWTAGRI
jgi:hypothetical protein